MALFNKIAYRYDQWYQTPRGSCIDAIQKKLVWDMAEVTAGERVLDLGCGTGNYTLELARYGCVTTGIDLSAGMLAAAKSKADAANCKIDWIEADFLKLPFASATFDFVLSVTAFEFVADPRAALLEAMRVLKPGGRVVIGVLARDSAWGDLYRKEARDNPDSVFAAARLYSAGELRELFPDCRCIKGGLFVPPGPPEIEVVEAMALENMGQLQYNNSNGQIGNPGFLVARWDKPFDKI
ncbi:2-methoxy-6-polyprenyl-1,4-benzoquinol methylase, mitochondrial [Sporomusa carbonis]